MGGYGKAMHAYATFQGRASRAEFWQFLLVAFLIHVGAYILLGPGPGRSAWPTLLFLILVLAHTLPYLAVLARRLHDIDATGWWALAGLVPLLGLGLLIPAAFSGTTGANRFGPAPATTKKHTGVRPPSPQGEQPLTSQQASPSNPERVIAQMEKLAQLRADGTISETEFENMKARLMGREQKV